MRRSIAPEPVTVSRLAAVSGYVVSWVTVMPRPGQVSTEAMKRLTNRSPSSAVYTSSPYFAWFSSPVPTQHQKQFWGVDTTR